MIPEWNHSGVLPPIQPGQASHSAGSRAPYQVSLLDLVDRFAFNAARAAILQGFFRYRADLHATGIVDGFQWINGSFAEDSENHRQMRPPNDIDVVTFYHSPDSDFSEYQRLFDSRATKETFLVDAYGLRLGEPVRPATVRQIVYWYSMWAHQRDGLWKGFVEVDLRPDGDATARQALNLEIQRRGWR